MIDALVAYFHYLAMMCLLAALVGEHLLLGGDPGSGRLRQLAATAVFFWYFEVPTWYLEVPTTGIGTRSSRSHV